MKIPMYLWFWPQKTEEWLWRDFSQIWLKVHFWYSS
jgi:hypothetical protein